MKKKINTKHYGERNILSLEPIDGIDELFIAEVCHNKYRTRIKGIIDKNYREVVPFGELHRMIGTRVINDHIVIVDCVAVAGCYDIGWTDDYGSLLLMKDEEEFKIKYNSNASIMYVTHDMLLGANYETSEENAYNMQYEDEGYPIKTYEYDYRKDELIRQVDFDFSESKTGELDAYFQRRMVPYPKRMRTLTKVGTLDKNPIYELQ